MSAPAPERPETENARQGRRSTLERLHRMLSAFDYEHPQLTLSELSRRCNLPLSTAHRMVTELVELGMLERDEQDPEQLSIGIDLWKFGLLTPKTHGVQRVALPFMQDLYATTGLPIHLGIPENGAVTVVESLRRRAQRWERPRIGQRTPYHLVAIGMAILAFSPPEVQEEYLAELERNGTGCSLSPADVRRHLAQARTDGYAANSVRTAPQVGLGAPVLDRWGDPVAAVSIVAPGGTAQTPYGHMARSAARAIQRTSWEQGFGGMG